MQRTLRPLLPLVLVSCASTPSLPFHSSGPGSAPQVFAPTVVSTDERIELNAALSPDGRELSFTRLDPAGRMVLYQSRHVDGYWSAPRPIQAFADGEGETAVDMTYSPNGDRLTFLGRAPGGIGDPPSLDLWQMRRDGGGWTAAEVLAPPISTEHSEIYPCIVADGSLYFSSDRPGGAGDYDVYRAQARADGTFEAPVNLGPPVNTEHSDGDCWVSPDESLLVVASRRPGGLGSSDLWVARRTDDGGWSEPVNLGAPVNTPGLEYCPMGTWDGRAFFFSRRVGESWAETTGGTVYWVDPSVLDVR